MSLLVSAFGLLILAVGGLGIFQPQTVVEGIVAWSPQTRLRIAIGVRVAMGIVLLLAAPACRHPVAVQVLGAIALFAAAVLPLIGAMRLDALVRWWLERPAALLRTQFAVAFAFGAFLVYTGL